MIELTVDSVQVSLVSNQRVVLLKQRDAECYLPIWIGPFEADAIALEMGGARIARPLTHDLLKSVISTLGATVSYIYINDLSNNTFYARIILETDSRRLEVDSRPSDAIALAVRVKVPIYVAEEVMDQASIVPSPPVESSLTEEQRSEDEDLAAFEEFVDSLDIEDLGEDNPDALDEE